MCRYTHNIRPVIGCRIACDVDVRFSITRSGRIARDYTTVQIFIISLFKKRRGNANDARVSSKSVVDNATAPRHPGVDSFRSALRKAVRVVSNFVKLQINRGEIPRCKIARVKVKVARRPSIKIGTCQPRKRHFESAFSPFIFLSPSLLLPPSSLLTWLPLRRAFDTLFTRALFLFTLYLTPDTRRA